MRIGRLIILGLVVLLAGAAAADDKVTIVLGTGSPTNTVTAGSPHATAVGKWYQVTGGKESEDFLTFQLTGTASATVVIQTTLDGTTPDTPFTFTANGQIYEIAVRGGMLYRAVATAFTSGSPVVVAGAATVAISPVLQLTAAAGSRIEAQPYLKGPWARYHGQTYFTDDEIQSIAMNALGRWGETIKRSGTPDETLFRAVRTLAFERMLGDDDYIDAMAADDRGTALSEKIKAKRDLGDRDRALFKHPTSRSVNFSVEI